MRLEMKTTVTEAEEELGIFEAIVSAWDEDRVGDVILPTAYDKTIRAWKQSGKWLPLLFEHSTRSVGEIDPESLKATTEGLRVRGHVDQATDEGEQVWRQIKSNTASFSIGFKAETRPRKGGKGSEIFEIDLLEISFTSTPVHPSARVLSWKSEAGATWTTSLVEPRIQVDGDVLSYNELRQRIDDEERRERLWREVREKAAQLEAEERAAEEEASRPTIPTTEQPFETDDGKVLVLCSEESCTSYPATELGAWRPIAPVRRWWCPTHKHLAQPGDDEPPERAVIVGPWGQVWISDSERERRRKARQKLIEEEQEREAQQRREDEALDRVRKNYERDAVISVAGLRVHPDGRIAR